jgi:polyisoprenoid-binding protein YceI
MAFEYLPMKRWPSFHTLRYAVLLILSLSAKVCNSQTYSLVSSESKVEFSIKNLGVQVAGYFAQPTGELKVNSSTGHPEFLYGEIQVRNIETGIAMRDRHLLKSEYFHADRYPQLKFRTESISISANGYILKGWISIKGKSQLIQLQADIIKSNRGYLIKSKFQLKRSTFNLGDSALLSDEVQVSWILLFGT